MKLREIVEKAINPALALLPAAMDSKPARVELLAIGLQESRFEHRRQINGPARGFWQFERGGGVRGVIQHNASRYWASLLCQARGCGFDSASVYRAIETDDVLAAGFARLLLFTDPKRLPAPDDAAGGWELYLRTWRPGRPHPETWPGLHAEAARAVCI